MQDAKDSAFLSAGHCSQDGVCVASGAEAYLCWFVYGAAGAWAAGGGSPKHHSCQRHAARHSSVIALFQ